MPNMGWDFHAAMHEHKENRLQRRMHMEKLIQELLVPFSKKVEGKEQPISTLPAVRTTLSNDHSGNPSNSTSPAHHSNTFPFSLSDPVTDLTWVQQREESIAQRTMRLQEQKSRLAAEEKKAGDLKREFDKWNQEMETAAATNPLVPAVFIGSLTPAVSVPTSSSNVVPDVTFSDGNIPSISDRENNIDAFLRNMFKNIDLEDDKTKVYISQFDEAAAANARKRSDDAAKTILPQAEIQPENRTLARPVQETISIKEGLVVDQNVTERKESTMTKESIPVKTEPFVDMITKDKENPLHEQAIPVKAGTRVDRTESNHRDIAPPKTEPMVDKKNLLLEQAIDVKAGASVDIRGTESKERDFPAGVTASQAEPTVDKLIAQHEEKPMPEEAIPENGDRKFHQSTTEIMERASKGAIIPIETEPILNNNLTERREVRMLPNEDTLVKADPLFDKLITKFNEPGMEKEPIPVMLEPIVHNSIAESNEISKSAKAPKTFDLIFEKSLDESKLVSIPEKVNPVKAFPNVEKIAMFAEYTAVLTDAIVDKGIKESKERVHKEAIPVEVDRYGTTASKKITGTVEASTTEIEEPRPSQVSSKPIVSLAVAVGKSGAVEKVAVYPTDLPSVSAAERMQTLISSVVLKSPPASTDNISKGEILPSTISHKSSSMNAVAANDPAKRTVAQLTSIPSRATDTSALTAASPNLTEMLLKEESYQLISPNNYLTPVESATMKKSIPTMPISQVEGAPIPHVASSASLIIRDPRPDPADSKVRSSDKFPPKPVLRQPGANSNLVVPTTKSIYRPTSHPNLSSTTTEQSLNQPEIIAELTKPSVSIKAASLTRVPPEGIKFDNTVKEMDTVKTNDQATVSSEAATRTLQTGKQANVSLLTNPKPTSSTPLVKARSQLNLPTPQIDTHFVSDAPGSPAKTPISTFAFAPTSIKSGVKISEQKRRESKAIIETANLTGPARRAFLLKLAATLGGVPKLPEVDRGTGSNGVSSSLPSLLVTSDVADTKSGDVKTSSSTTGPQLLSPLTTRRPKPLSHKSPSTHSVDDTAEKKN